MRHQRTVWLLFLFASHLASCDQLHDQQKRLDDGFRNQVFIIRNFYTDDKLVFNSSGALIRGGKSDCWAAAQFLIKKIILKKDRLTLEGNRVVGSYDMETMKMTNQGESRKVKVEIQLDPQHMENQDILNLLAKIFLTRNDKLEELIPAANQDLTLPQSVTGTGAVKIGAGIVPPKPTYAPDPEYTDAARKARRQGTVKLWAVIGTDGTPHNIKVMNCLGYGLEQESVKAVSTWKLEPARKNGQLIAVQLYITVSFRLY
jgi:TonB family protein